MYTIKYYITNPPQADIFPVGTDDPENLDAGLAKIANSSEPNDRINFNIVRTESMDGDLTIHLWEEAGEEFYVQAELEGATAFEFATGEPQARLDAAKNKVRVLFAQLP